MTGTDPSKAPVMAFVNKVREGIFAAKKQLGVKHNRKEPPTKNKVRYKTKNGFISVVAISTNKGEIMSHKGKGGTGARKEKPFINEPVSKEIEPLADELAMNWGDVVCSRLIK